MATPTPSETQLRIAALPANRPTPFVLTPDTAARSDLATDLEVQEIRKLRFEGDLTPEGRAHWTLRAKLGATVVQSCVVTLEPVTTRIDVPVTLHYVPARLLDEPEAGSEIEMPEEDNRDALPDVLDLTEVMAEALSLALPAYPRKDDATLGEAVYAEDGVTPMRDEDTKPFAGLAALKAKLTPEGGVD